MNEPERQQIGKAAKIMRFGCGAVFGMFAGLYFIVKWNITSLELGLSIWFGTVLACGCLAMKYGDGFWYGMFGGHK